MWRYACILLFASGLTHCGGSNPVGNHAATGSAFPVGPLTIGTWRPFGLTRTDLDRMTAGFATDLHLNQIESTPRQLFSRAEVAAIAPDLAADDISAEQLATRFVQAANLRMPLFFEPRGFGDHDKLINWATCNFPADFVAGCQDHPDYPEYEQQIRAIVRAHRRQLTALNGSMAGIQGYVVMDEIEDKAKYTGAFYPAMAAAVRIIRDEDPTLPAIAVGIARAFADKGSPAEFMRAFFGGGVYDPPNIFQQDHYVFWEDIPFERDDPDQVGGKTVQGQIDALLDGYDEVCRLAVQYGGRWHAIVQAQGETRPDGIGFRKPLPSEIRVQVGLALSRGASGIVYFVHSSGDEGNGRVYSGLVDEAGGETGRYAAVREINGDLQKVSAELAPLFFQRSLRWDGTVRPATVPPNRLFRGVAASGGSAGGRLEFGMFGEGGTETHLLVVNRRTHAAQRVELLVTREPVFDAVTGAALAVEDVFARKLRKDRRLTIDLEPGGFRLLRFE